VVVIHTLFFLIAMNNKLLEFSNFIIRSLDVQTGLLLAIPILLILVYFGRCFARDVMMWKITVNILVSLFLLVAHVQTTAVMNPNFDYWSDIPKWIALTSIALMTLQWVFDLIAQARVEAKRIKQY